MFPLRQLRSPGARPTRTPSWRQPSALLTRLPPRALIGRQVVCSNRQTTDLLLLRNEHLMTRERPEMRGDEVADVRLCGDGATGPSAGLCLDVERVGCQVGATGPDDGSGLGIDRDL